MYANAIKFLKEFVDNFVNVYKVQLPILAHKYNELSKLYYYQNDCQKAEKYGLKARELYSVFYKDIPFKEKDELNERLVDVQNELKIKK